MSSLNLNDETLNLYLDESRDHLATIETDLLAIESNGKNIDGWWVDIASENKAGEKQQVKKEIQCEIIEDLSK